MADEPENMVLVQLREIRAKLAEHDKRFDHLEKRFDRLDEQGADSRQFLAHALGLGAMNEMKARAFEVQQMDFATRQKRTEEMIAVLDRRLAKVEERAD